LRETSSEGQVEMKQIEMSSVHFLFFVVSVIRISLS